MKWDRQKPNSIFLRVTSYTLTLPLYAYEHSELERVRERQTDTVMKNSSHDGDHVCLSGRSILISSCLIFTARASSRAGTTPVTRCLKAFTTFSFRLKASHTLAHFNKVCALQLKVTQFIVCLSLTPSTSYVVGSTWRMLWVKWCRMHLLELRNQDDI